MSRRPPPSRKRPPPVEIEAVVERLGTEGAGLVRHGDGVLLVPDTLPGERVRLSLTGPRAARVLARFNDNPSRVPAACRHFGVCGGCALQQAGPALYAQYKRDLVADALSRHGLGAVEVLPALITPPGGRRRAVLEARRAGGRVRLGFHGRASHDIVDLLECPILAPALVDLVPPLRRLLAALLPSDGAASVNLTLTRTGVDLGIVLPGIPDLAGLEALAAFAAERDLARLWWRVAGQAAVPAALRRPPQARFGDVDVDLPMGGFLQASLAGEAALTEIVRAGVDGAARVADLFAGCGTFALALAGAVHAVESDAAALGALASAARRAGRVQVTTERRDLDIRPLLAAELKPYQAVVFDPPRAGARAQVAELAVSGVPVVVAVSCNPASFARDAAILVAGGYRLEAVRPVDQFLWSNHMELTALFRRG